MGWLPDPVERLLEVALVGELTVIGHNRVPVTHPLIPLYHDGRIYLHSSTLFSKKLEHIKRDARVSLAITGKPTACSTAFTRAARSWWRWRSQSDSFK